MSPSSGHCLVFLGETFYSESASPHKGKNGCVVHVTLWKPDKMLDNLVTRAKVPRIQDWILEGGEGKSEINFELIPLEKVVILLAALCLGNPGTPWQCVSH